MSRYELEVEKLNTQKALNKYRITREARSLDSIAVEKEGKYLLNFSANDYMGLSKHDALKATAIEYTNKYGLGATASRLVISYDIYEELETMLAQMTGYESALLFPSGYQANNTVIPALLTEKSLVICDKLVHNSIIQGVLQSKAKFLRYQHQDYERLEEVLDKEYLKPYDRIMIITETVFSMDGDCLDIATLQKIAVKYNAFLFLDDAHGIGVFGQDGMGIASYQKNVDVMLGTFSKALGSMGAFIACSRVIRDYLVNFCSGFIYTTGLPPGVVGAVKAALTLLPDMEAERSYLHSLAEEVRKSVKALGFSTGLSCSQILPVIIGDSKKTLRCSAILEEEGILGVTIRPPTVPEKSARIRLALSCKHTKEHIQILIRALQRCKSLSP
jgi:8-amino-7-oxononanoate synthase